jgi:hypothetical protein
MERALSLSFCLPESRIILALLYVPVVTPPCLLTLCVSLCFGYCQVRSELKALEEVSRQHKQQQRQSKADERMSKAIDELKDMYGPYYKERGRTGETDGTERG